MKHKRERKHTFIEVENEITYEESIVNKSRAENLILFRHFTIDVAYLVFVICVNCKTLFFFAYEVLKIIKISCNTLTLQQ